MSKRTTLVLVVVNALLVAFLVFVDRGQLSTTELAQRSSHVLQRFVRERVDRVELVRGDDPAIVLVRVRDPEDEEASGTWRLAEPVDGAADEDAVDSVLSALEFLDARRRLETISAEDRTRFGLDAPRFVVRFQVGDEHVALRVGGEAPTGEGVYADVEGEERGYVVGPDFVEAIDHAADHFRDKILFADLYLSTIASVRVSGGGPAVRLAREGTGPWTVETPVRGHASGGLVDGLARALRELSARRFVAEEAGDLARFGLDAPSREVVVTRTAGEGAARRQRLRVGGECADHPDERYAIAGDAGPVVCVAASDLTALELDREALREARAITVSSDAVERVELVVGERRLTLRRADSAWEMVDGETTAPADDAAIASWLDALRDTRALAFEDVEGDPPHGVGAPRATLTLHRSDEETEHRLALGEEDAEGLWVRRDDEAAVVRLPSAAGALLMPDALRFRRRTLVEGVEADDARLVTLRRGAVTERAVRDDGGAWMLEAPLAAEADRGTARELARTLAGLVALRFVAAAPTAEHGLATPSASLSVRYEPEDGEARTIELALGAATVDGAYARLDGAGPVFEVSRAHVETTERSLLSLDLFSVATADIASIRLERGAETLELRRDGEAFRVGDATPDVARTRALLDGVATLRASGVARYGAAPSTADVRVTITRRDREATPRVVTFAIGPVAGEGDAATAPVWREDLAVELRAPAASLEIFRTFAP